MRPTAPARMGLAQPQQRFGQLSLIEILGHAEDPEVSGHDLNYQAVRGTLTLPHMPRVPIADMLGAEHAVSTALAALVHRAKTGTGQQHRVALEDAAATRRRRGQLSADGRRRHKAVAVVDRCVQFFGGYGYMMEYPIARAYAAARVNKIYGGASDHEGNHLPLAVTCAPHLIAVRHRGRCVQFAAGSSEEADSHPPRV